MRPAARAAATRRDQSGGPVGMLLSFLDDLRNVRANAVLIVGVLCFAGLVSYHSERLFGDRGRGEGGVGRGGGKVSGLATQMQKQLKAEVQDLEKEMTNILQNHAGVSRAAEDAKRAVRMQHTTNKNHKAAAILVFKTPGTNLHLAMRNLAKQIFVKEIVLIHDLSAANKEAQDDEEEEWKPPKEVYGKPVHYETTTGERREMQKYYACARSVQRKDVDVCFFQMPTRDTSGYIKSLWASFLRAPNLLHTAVGATTFYNDEELQFREDAFGIDAGFAYLNGGAFFLKASAEKFVARVETLWDEMYKVGNIDLEAAGYNAAADVYFSLWQNRPHVELDNDIVPYKRQIDEPRVYERNAYARRRLQTQAHVLAVKQLILDALASKKKGQRFNTTGAYRTDAYSSCGTDDCVLITNIPPVKPTVAMSAHLIGGLMASMLTRETSPEKCDVFKAHQYHYAVDGNPQTQWVTTNTNVTGGDYFGLDLLKLHKDLANVTVVAAHPFQSQMLLEVSMGGVTWYPLVSKPAVKVVDSWRGFAVSQYVYDLSEDLSTAWEKVLALPRKHHRRTPTPPLYIRYVRFRAAKSFALPLVVFDLTYATGDSADGVALSQSKLRGAGEMASYALESQGLADAASGVQAVSLPESSGAKRTSAGGAASLGGERRPRVRTSGG